MKTEKRTVFPSGYILAWLILIKAKHIQKEIISLNT